MLFSGINPGLYSAATGHHFARPGNRFWRTPAPVRFHPPAQLRPDEQYLLPSLGLGITDLVDRATARADELSAAELRDGGQALLAKAGRRLRPAWLAVVGVTAYRTAFGEPRGRVGPQRLAVAATRVWVLPNPSGLNAHWTAATLAGEFARLREVAFPAPGGAAAFSPRTWRAAW